MKGFVKFNGVAAALALVLASSAVIAQTAPAKTGAPAAQEWKWKTEKLSKSKIDALLAKPEKLVILDVRRPDELTKIGGFPAYLSIQVADLENNLAFIPKDRAILTVSNHAGRAGQVGDLLASKGFKVAGAAGAETYEQEGGKISHVLPPAPKPTAAN
ncbi:MAG: sulfurtransferase [Verrucomicrobiaceae bacterium]|nr:sulfurtransferase [Verrucomicrobiaceae bacterium]